MIKDKFLKIRATQAEKDKVVEVYTKHGFTSLASFFWFTFNQWKRKRGI